MQRVQILLRREENIWVTTRRSKLYKTCGAALYKLATSENVGANRKVHSDGNELAEHLE